MRSLRRSATPYLLLAPGLLWLLFFFALPLYSMARVSLESGNIYEGFHFAWDFGNYKHALSVYDEQLVRSFFYAGTATLAPANPSAADGVLSVSHGDQITATYQDASPAATLVALLQPHTKVILPYKDHWLHDYSYNSDNLTWYSLESFGRDGIDGVNITTATRLQFELDIVYATGRFSNAPD